MKCHRPLPVLVAAVALVLAGCGDRDARQAKVATTIAPPPPVDASMSGAPTGALPAPSSTAPVPPGDPVAAHFRTLDANGNGTVTPAEHTRGAAALFLAMDTDHDDEVTAAEMDAAQAALGGDARMAPVDRIRELDRSGDGILGAIEHASGALTMFATLDIDANGKLDLGEVRAGHDRMLGDRVPRPMASVVTPG